MLPKSKIITREVNYEGSPLTVASDGVDLYVLPEQLAHHLSLPWEKAQRSLSRSFDPVAFGGPPLRSFRAIASEVIPLFLIRQWITEMLKLTIKRNPEHIAEMEQATLTKLKRICSKGEDAIGEVLTQARHADVFLPPCPNQKQVTHRASIKCGVLEP